MVAFFVVYGGCTASTRTLSISNDYNSLWSSIHYNSKQGHYSLSLKASLPYVHYVDAKSDSQEVDFKFNFPGIEWSFSKHTRYFDFDLSTAYRSMRSQLTVTDTLLPNEYDPLPIIWNNRIQQYGLGVRYKANTWSSRVSGQILWVAPKDLHQPRHEFRDSSLVAQTGLEIHKDLGDYRLKLSALTLSGFFHVQGLRLDSAHDLKRYALIRSGFDWNHAQLEWFPKDSLHKNWTMQLVYDWVHGDLFPTRYENNGETFSANRLLPSSLLNIMLFSFYNKAWNMSGQATGQQFQLGSDYQWKWSRWTIQPSLQSHWIQANAKLTVRVTKIGLLGSLSETRQYEYSLQSALFRPKITVHWQPQFLDQIVLSCYAEQWIPLAFQYLRNNTDRPLSERGESIKNFRNGFLAGAKVTVYLL